MTADRDQKIFKVGRHILSLVREKLPLSKLADPNISRKALQLDLPFCSLEMSHLSAGHGKTNRKSCLFRYFQSSCMQYGNMTLTLTDKY